MGDPSHLRFAGWGFHFECSRVLNPAFEKTHPGNTSPGSDTQRAEHVVPRRGFVVRYRPKEPDLSDFTPEPRSQMSRTPDPTDFTLGGYTGPSRVIEGVKFWPRVAARLIDSVVLVFLASLAGALFGVVTKHRATGITVFIFSLLAGVAYHTICEGLHGSTMGKLALQMVVVSEGGTPCDLDAALKREIAYFFDGLFFGLIGYVSMKNSPQEQRYGDHWAQTIVCKRAAVAPQYLRSGGRFAAVLALAALVNIALVMTGFLLA